MTAAVGATNNVASLQADLERGLGQLQALTGGGATGATTATTATGGAQAAAGQAQQIPATTAGGRAVVIIKDANGVYKLQAGTGFDETVTADGKTLRFDAKGNNVRNFEVAARNGIRVELDGRQGIAAGISNLSKVVAGRQERLKQLQEALALDVNESGSTNQLDIQRLVTEQQATEHLSNMNHKIYESVQNAIGPWLR